MGRDSRNKWIKILVMIVIIAGFALLAEFFLWNNFEKPTLSERPAPKEFSEESSAPVEVAQTKPEPDFSENHTPDLPNDPPEQFLLEIPFYSQAPLGNWDAVHEDMCEEASLLNGGLYLLEKRLTLAKYEEELQKMKKIEERLLGEWKSNPVSDIKKLSDEYFDGQINAKVLDNPTTEDIEREIAAGNPVIAPLAGREIGNPNFTPPGPIYHMLVIKGYDGKNFITNDVGTRKGESYVYRKEVILQNIHDWNEKDINLGKKSILVLSK